VKKRRGPQRDGGLEAGATAMIQPGCPVRDDEAIAAADAVGLGPSPPAPAAFPAWGGFRWAGPMSAIGGQAEIAWCHC